MPCFAIIDIAFHLAFSDLVAEDREILQQLFAVSCHFSLLRWKCQRLTNTETSLFAEQIRLHLTTELGTGDEVERGKINSYQQMKSSREQIS